MQKIGRRWLCAGLLIIAAGTAEVARAAQDEGVEEIVAVLREKGLIDDAQQNQILAKHAAAEAKRTGSAAGPFFSGLDLNGDFRLRWDHAHFNADESGQGLPDRSRFRYRLRVGVRKQLNPDMAVGFRIVSGFNFNRGQDQELGHAPDFAPDPIQIDRAFFEYGLGDTAFGLKSTLIAGKTENPFRWGKGPDTLVVDQDLSFAGATLRERLNLSENAWLFATLGGYMIQEFPTRSDPKLFGSQVGAGFRPARDWELGIRGSTYFFRSLDTGTGSFTDRATSAGNLGGPSFSSAFPGDKARIGELSTYANFTGLAEWPLLVWAQIAKNFSAQSSVISGIPVGSENQAYGLGLQIGDSRRFMSLGVAFYQVEANSVLSQFTDPDFSDGTTNSRGYGIYLERTIRDGAYFRVQFYDSNSLRTSGGIAGPFANSIRGHDRRRLQTDLVLTF
jgi:hypothetical protein